MFTGNSKVVVRAASSCKISHSSITLEAITHFFCKLLKFPLLIMFLTFINKMEVHSFHSKRLCSLKETERQVLNGDYNCNKPVVFIPIQGYHVTSNMVTCGSWCRVGNRPFSLLFDTKFSNIPSGDEWERGRKRWGYRSQFQSSLHLLQHWTNFFHLPDVVTQQHVVLYYWWIKCSNI